MYTLLGTVHVKFYPTRPPWWPGKEICRLLTVPTPLVFSQYSDWDIRHQPGQSNVCSIAMIAITVLAVLQFLYECCNGTVGFTCRNDPMCRNGQGVLLPLAANETECIDQLGLCWFKEGSFFNHICSIVAVSRSTMVDCTGLSGLDTILVPL